MASDTEIQILLKLVEETKNGQVNSVRDIRTLLEGVSIKLEKYQEASRESYAEAIMKVESTSRLHAQLKTDHVELKESLVQLVEDVKGLNKLKNYILLAIGICVSVIGIFWKDFLQYIKSIVFVVNNLWGKGK